MSSLLRRSIVSSASKSGSCRRCPPSISKGSQSAGDSWFVSNGRSFWYRSTRSAHATTAQSALSCFQDRQEQQPLEQSDGSRSSHTRLVCDNIYRPPRPYLSTNISSNARFLTTSSRAGQVSSWKNRNHVSPNVRYACPPSSIRATLNLNQLILAERAASDMAFRALTTWACQYQNALVQSSSANPRCLSNGRAVLFSTNSDGSRYSGDHNHIAKTGIRKTQIPTPESGKQRSMKAEDVMKEVSKKTVTVVLPAILKASKAVMMFLLRLPFNIVYYISHPQEAKEKWNDVRQFIRDEIDHYWVGTKLLWADLKTARALIRRLLRGSSLTRRERKQLLRTISDLFRLIPFSMFLIIPLMEFALPFALKIFPNLLPSTFQDSLKAEENMKRELQMRIAMAKFFQETMEELAKEQKRSASHLKEEIKDGSKSENVDESVVTKQEESAQSMLEFLEKARNGEMIPNEVITRYAHYFRDDLTLDNMPRMQLINMCKYMSIPPYGSDSFLRFQLRHRMRSLREDDQRILWEGIDSLTKMELREACQERGMRSTGLSKDSYKRALQQWLDLSVKQNVPTSLLIMSRTFFLREEMFERDDRDGTKSLAGLADAISGLDKEVVNEVILDVATSQEKMSDPGVRKIKLEVLMKQNELIEQEQAEREEAAAKKKEQAEKEKMEATEKEKVASETPESAQAAEPETISRPMESSSFSTEEQKPKKESPEKSTREKEAKDLKFDEDLSTAEMDAISQLVSADPVSRERADLESIKAAMSGQGDKGAPRGEKNVDGSGGSSDSAEFSKPRVTELTPSSDADMQFMSSDDSGKLTTRHVEEAVDSTEMEGAQSTKLSDELTKDSYGSLDEQPVKEAEASDDGKENEDPVVARLKKRIESMVDKIEVQLSDVQVKIGDKLHVLDKDMDGILSVDEIAEALQQVLKRKITYEEAYEIARQMDENKDGVFTVQELIQWIETNQLVKFVEEGRDADMDRIIEKQSTSETSPEKDEEFAGDTSTNQTAGKNT